MVFYYVSLGIIFAISLVVIREDIGCKKIRNKWIISGFTLGFLLLLISFILGMINFDYLMKVAINTIISLLATFIIWRLEFWPAGDAKLFTLFSFLLPLYYYWKTYLEYFPSFVLLVNIFALFLIFVFLKSCYNFSKTFAMFFEKNNNCRKTVIEYLEKAKKSGSKLKNGKFLIKVFLRLAIGTLIYFALSKFYLKTPFKFTTFLVSLAVFSIVAVFLKFHINKYSRKRIAIESLDSGTKIADETISELKKNKNLIKEIGRIRSDGLEEYQVNLIKNYFLKNNVREIYAYDTIPFSVWIIAGVIGTVLFKGIIALRF